MRVELTEAEARYLLACMDVADESAEQADLHGVDQQRLREKLRPEGNN